MHRINLIKKYIKTYKFKNILIYKKITNLILSIYIIKQHDYTTLKSIFLEGGLAQYA